MADGEGSARRGGGSGRGVAAALAWGHRPPAAPQRLARGGADPSPPPFVVQSAVMGRMGGNRLGDRTWDCGIPIDGAQKGELQVNFSILSGNNGNNGKEERPVP